MSNNQYKKFKNKLKKQRIYAVDNYSSMTLSQAEENVLNRGLNFAIMPLNLDITQVLTEFRRFERTMLWHEFWFGKESEETYEPPLFKILKTNLPQKHKTPQGLKDYLAAVKSDLMDPKSRNKIKSNLPEEEKEALKNLIKLQQDRVIVIKKSDKGSGITIVDFNQYMKSCNEHLGDKTASGEHYYEKVTKERLEKASYEVNLAVAEGFDKDILSKEEFNAMKIDEVKPGKFYAQYKTHKKHNEGDTPPIRPIVSASGSSTENIALFVEKHIKDEAKSHDTFIQDTPDFLRNIEQLNYENKVEDDDILVVIDVVGLYTNIPTEEGVKSVKKRLEKRTNPKVPSVFIVKLLELVLKHSIFEFNSELWLQLIGTAMGASPAPSYANMFMAESIDDKIKILAQKLSENGSNPIKLMKRFLDDIFILYKGSVRNLHRFFQEVNKINKHIKFTMNHTTPRNSEPNQCECEIIESIPFLDTLCKIENGKIKTTLYRKPSDKVQYLLTDSCHPIQQVTNIPFSLCLRINRICSDISDRDKEYMNLKEMPMSRNYPEGILDAAIAKARVIPRHQALKYVPRQDTQKRPVFVISYDPRLPDIPKIINKHWRSMTHQDQHLKTVFESPPLIAYRRQQNIKESIIRAKVAPIRSKYPKRNLQGFRKCGKCKACSYMKERKFIKTKGKPWKITKNVNCESTNVIYILECQKEQCKQKYIGETERKFIKRVYEHIGYARNKVISQTTGYHFNLPGHSTEDMKFSIIEKVKKNDSTYRKEREKYHINKFNAHYDGMNNKQ